jgi:hypothetical protein
MQLTALEHSCAIVAAGGLGAKVLVGISILGLPLWTLALAAGLIVGGGSFVIRKGYRPSL